MKLVAAVYFRGLYLPVSNHSIIYYDLFSNLLIVYLNVISRFQDVLFDPRFFFDGMELKEKLWSL